jgi:predicted nucleic acid-binding protein
MKTYVLDASAMLAFLLDAPGAYRVNELLKESRLGHTKMMMSAVNYGEVYAKFLLERGAAEALMALQAVSPLPIELMDATPRRACAAAEVKAKHKLYYADSFAAALAIEHKATLVTSDSDFRRLGRSFSVVWLKN